MGIQSDVSHLVSENAASQTQGDFIAVQRQLLSPLFHTLQGSVHISTPWFADDNFSASTFESDGSCHQAQFPDIVHEEQQKAEGVHHVLTNWNSRGGVPASDLPSSLLAPLMRLQRSFVLSDPNQPDCPIVHASTAFLLMTGYPRWVHTIVQP